MKQLDRAPVSAAEVVEWLTTRDVNSLGLRADALSRSRHRSFAGYRRVRNVTVGAKGVTHPDLHADETRLVDVAADCDADAVYAAIVQLARGGAWVEGLITSDLERLGLEPARLVGCGLRRLLGGHCETFTHARRHVRGTHDWNDAMTWLRSAAKVGLRLQVDLLYGDGESQQVLAQRLLAVRQLQEETQAVDALVLIPHHAARAVETPTEITFGFDDMRLLSAARLVLDNVAHIQVPWLPFGLKAAQMGLIFGGDDLGPWCLDPGVTEEAHVATLLALREEEVIMAIKDSGRQPVLWKGQE